MRMDQGQTGLLPGMGAYFMLERHPKITGKGDGEKRQHFKVS